MNLGDGANPTAESQPPVKPDTPPPQPEPSSGIIKQPSPRARVLVGLLLVVVAVIIFYPIAQLSLGLATDVPRVVSVASAALFGTVLILWLSDSIGFIAFSKDWISKAIWRAAIIAILSTSVVVFGDYLNARSYPYAGNWQLTLAWTIPEGKDFVHGDPESMTDLWRFDSVLTYDPKSKSYSGQGVSYTFGGWIGDAEVKSLDLTRNKCAINLKQWKGVVVDKGMENSGINAIKYDSRPRVCPLVFKLSPPEKDDLARSGRTTTKIKLISVGRSSQFAVPEDTEVTVTLTIEPAP